MTRSTHVKLSKLSLALVAALAMAPAFAQSLSSGVSGTVTGADGSPVAGADVTITHVESGTIRHATTDASGRYAAQGLRVGGPYTITVNSASGTDTENDVYLELNQVSTVNAQLGGAAATLDTVTVTATRIAPVFNTNNKGLGTSLSGRKLETTVSGNRSLDDIARIDPRINVTDQGDGSISLAGQNNRYNNISVDGLSVNDPFGLNANGLGFTGSPISPDTIAAYDIKVSDYDASSDSVGANINAVTKSGTNEFHGSVYGVYNNAEDMVGNGRKGSDGSYSDYAAYDTNKTFGATIGGPIVKDRLFFFASYEDQKITGLAGAGADALTTGNLTQAQVDDVANAFQKIGIDTGGGGGDVVQEDKRYLAKIDWNITDRQRASFTYQRTEETKPTPYNSYTGEHHYLFPSNWYTTANKTDNYSLQLFSDWTDNFSTELKVGYQKYAANNGASSDQPEVVACFTDVASECSGNAPVFRNIRDTNAVVAGEDWYRHENAITSKRISATLSGTYYAGDHTIKGGFDYLSNLTADIFGQGLHGSYAFYDKNGNGSPVDEILAGDYSSFDKTYLPDGVTLAASAGTWKYSQISPFLQDTWQATDNLSLTFGVRVDIPRADRSPPVAVEGLNRDGDLAPGVTLGAPVWESRFGYPSNTTLGSHNKVVEPRFAFNYTFNTQRPMQLRGGIGQFQSVPPYVWLTNPYVNNGVVSSKGYHGSDPSVDPFSSDPYNQPGPTSAPAGECSTSGFCTIDTLDPDFKLPTAWKASLAFDAELPWWGLVASIEDIYIKNHDAIAYIAPNIGLVNGALPDGRASYWTNGVPFTCPDPVDPDKTFPCDVNGMPISSRTNNGAYPEISTRSTELTNTDLGWSNSLTLSLSKVADNGLSGMVSATFTASKDVNPGSASQAYSNYNYYARVNPNDFVEANSRFNVPRSVKAVLNWDHAFFGDNRTTVSVFYNGHDGLPYSWVFGRDANGDGLGSDLAYIPLLDDPNVSYKGTPEQQAAFQDYINNNSYLSSHRGQIAGRNRSQSPWVNDLDLGLQQELPGFFGKDKFIVRLDIYNFLNLLNKDWGETENAGFFGTRTLVNIAGVDPGADGISGTGDDKYVYDVTRSPSDLSLYDANVSRVISRWSAAITLKYTF
jgi:hypothetical protein